MKRIYLLTFSLLFSTYFAIGQSFTNEYYQKALWMTTRFYGAQRSGKGNNWVIAEHTPTKTASGISSNIGAFVKGQDFVKDADGSYVLTGGWVDCGDNAKFGQTEFYAGYMLALGYSEFPEGYDDYYSQDYHGYINASNYTWEGSKGEPNGIPDILDEIKYATDFFIKCMKDETTFYYQVGDPGYDHQVWCTSPVKATLSITQGGESTGSRPVQKKSGSTTSMTSLCGATLAIMAREYKKFDPDYANTCLEKAIIAYNYVMNTTKGNTACTDASIYPAKPKYTPDIVTLCMELYRTTGESKYLTSAQQNCSWMESESGYNHNFSLCYNNTEDLACYLMAKYGTGTYATNAKTAFNFFVSLYKPSSGYFLNVKNDSWGVLRFPANQAFVYALNAKLNNNLTTVDPYTAETIDYILGKNSKSFSFVVGLGTNYPHYPHHRNFYLVDNNNESALDEGDNSKVQQLGYMVGGKLSVGDYSDNEKTYTSSEGGIDYNAGLVGALAYIVSRIAPVNTNKFGHPAPELGDDKTLCGVGSVTLTATVDLTNLKSGEAITYRWYKDAATTPFKTGTTLSSITVTEAAKYTCELYETSGNGWTTKDAVTVTATLGTVSLGDDVALCKETSATFDAGISGTGISYAWSKDAVTIPGATAKTYTAYTAGTYKVTVSASGCTAVTGSAKVTSSLPVVVGDTICAAGQVQLSVTTAGDYKWYNVATEGTALASGSTYSPSISASTTYYVQDAGSVNTVVGPAKSNITATPGNNGDWSVNFKTNSAVTITEMTAYIFAVYYGNTQSLTVTIGGDGTGTYKSSTTNITTGQYATFSFASNPIVISKAGNYTISFKLDNAAVGSVTTSSAYSAYQNPDILTITGTSNTNTSLTTEMVAVTDWKVQSGSTCARTPVLAVIDPNGNCGDAQAPTTPGTISVTNITTTSATATWTASTDNVGVTSYEVYVNGALLKTVTTNSVSLTGLTDNTAYTIKVRATDAAGNYSAFNTESSFTTLQATVTQTIALTSGWNLISFYVLPTDNTIANVLSGISSKVTIVKNNDGFYYTGKANELQSLTTFEFGQAYLIKTTSAATLTVQGLVPSSTTVQLKAGWNLLGYPKTTAGTASTELSSIWSNVSALKNLDGAQTTLTPGKGYYINMKAAGTVTIK